SNSEMKEAEASSDLAAHCRVCGRPFSSDETFCGHCSMPRVSASANGEGLQSKWASMWFMQQAQAARPERGSKSASFEPRLPKASTTWIAKPPEARTPNSQAPAVSSYSAVSPPPIKPAPIVPTRTEPLTSEVVNSVPAAGYSLPEHGLRILEDESAVD